MPRTKQTSREVAYRKNNILGTRLRMARIDAGMSQIDLTLHLQEYLDQPEPLSNLAISSYENGSRLPHITSLVGISKILGVTVDYLVGADSVKFKPSPISYDENEEKNKPPVPEFDLLIKKQSYENYDGYPVFVKSSTDLIVDRWGILDYHNNQIVFKEKNIPITTDMKLYRHKPLNASYIDYTTSRPLNMHRLFSEKLLWVEPFSIDDLAVEKYKGYYRHNEDHSMLMNITNGLTLPYTGLGVSYNAYPASLPDKK